MFELSNKLLNQFFLLYEIYIFKIYHKNNMTTIANVKVKHIRPTYKTLSDWMENSNHEYIGRGGVVFINKERFPKKSS